MKVKFNLSIGFPMATKELEVDFPDEELEGISKKEIDNIINEELNDWAMENMEMYYEVVE